MRKLVAVCLLLVLAGCTGPVADLNPFGHDRAPGEDPLGWENGYWYDDSLSVTAEDGLRAVALCQEILGTALDRRTEEAIQ